MLKNEWADLIKSKVFLLIIAAIVAIPTIYTTLFLGSMWDPYGNTHKLPVAIVNEDRAVDYEGKSLNVGGELVDNLKENDSLDFHFVDGDAAEQGLRDGSYYMVITIPEGFSQNASTLMDEHPRKMELICETNPGTNYIASKMSESALEKIKTSVAEEVTRTYTETVFDQIKEVGSGMEEAADGAGEINGGVMQLAEGNETLTENLKTLADSSLTFRDGGNTLNIGLNAYVGGVASLNAGAADLDSGAASLLTGIQTADSGAKDLHAGAYSLLEGAGGLNAGAAELKNGLDSLQDQIPALSSGVDSLNDGASVLSQGASKLAESGEALSAGVDSVDRGAEALKTGADALNDKTDGLAEAITALDGGASSLDAGAQNLKNGTAAVLDGAAQLQEGLEQLNTQSGELANGAQNLRDGLTAVIDHLSGTAAFDGTAGASNLQSAAEASAYSADNAYQVGAASASDLESRLEEAIAAGDPDQIAAVAREVAACAVQNENAVYEADAQITELTGRLNENSAALQNAANDLADVSGGNNDALIGQLSQLRDGSETLYSGISVYTGGVAALAQKAPELKEGANSVYNGAAELSAGAAGLHSGAEQLAGQTPALREGVASLAGGAANLKAGTSSLNSGSKSLAEGISQAEAGAEQLAAGTSQLKGNVPALGGGINRLTAGADSLQNGTNALLDGAETLYGGTAGLTDGTSQLAEGSQALKNGTASLLSGTDELVSNNGTLLDGAARLNEGAGQISEGAGLLYDGSNQLKDGISALADGSAELNEKLADGAEEVKNTSASEEALDMFSSPVSTDEITMTTVENNGHAMAPYMMSVALWVGCIAFCIMYPLMKYSGELKSGFRWWAGKASVLYTVAVVQAVVMVGALCLFNGFNPIEMGKTMLFAILTSVTFMSILYFFNVCMGKIGSFLMLIFMVVQLAGSAGTYPVELSGAFVPVIHWWLPFTYTVNAFRSTISGGESILPNVLVLLAILAVFTGLTLIVFRVRTRRIKEGKRVMNELLEEKGLM